MSQRPAKPSGRRDPTVSDQRVCYAQVHASMSNTIEFVVFYAADWTIRNQHIALSRLVCRVCRDLDSRGGETADGPDASRHHKPSTLPFKISQGTKTGSNYGQWKSPCPQLKCEKTQIILGLPR